MTAKKTRRITIARVLTADEAAEVRRLRELVEKDKDEIQAEGRRFLVEKRLQHAAAHGVPTLGQKIRTAREGRGWTQADLASRAKVAEIYLSSLEEEQREPSLPIAAGLARELEIPLEELAGVVAP
jgi:ribosome-binding protein aMBF1 (putative translation factor)